MVYLELGVLRLIVELFGPLLLENVMVVLETLFVFDVPSIPEMASG